MIQTYWSTADLASMRPRLIAVDDQRHPVHMLVPQRMVIRIARNLHLRAARHADALGCGNARSHAACDPSTPRASLSAVRFSSHISASCIFVIAIAFSRQGNLPFKNCKR